MSGRKPLILLGNDLEGERLGGQSPVPGVGRLRRATWGYSSLQGYSGEGEGEALAGFTPVGRTWTSSGANWGIS